MSRTKHNSKGPGYEYWGRRPCAGWGPGRGTKVVTHRLERRQQDRELAMLVDEAERSAEIDEALYAEQRGMTVAEMRREQEDILLDLILTDMEIERMQGD